MTLVLPGGVTSPERAGVLVSSYRHGSGVMSKAGLALLGHLADRTGLTGAAAGSQNGNTLQQPAQIPGSGGFLPKSLPKKAAQQD